MNLGILPFKTETSTEQCHVYPIDATSYSTKSR